MYYLKNEFRVCIFLIFLQIIKCNNDIDIKFIKDYVHYQQDIVGIRTFICWNTSEIIKFRKTLESIYIQTNTKSPWIFSQSEREFNLFILDFACANISEILDIANNKNYFVYPKQWMILLPENISEHYFSKYFIPISSKFILAKKNNSTNFDLSFIYNFRKNNSFTVNKFGVWRYEKGFVFYDNENIHRKRRNFRQNVLKTVVVILYNRTLEHMYDYRYPDEDVLTKLNFMLTLYVTYFLNASLHITYVSEWYKNGTDSAENQRNTALALIVSKDVDMSSAPFFCLKERLHLFHCITLTVPVTGGFLFKQPPLSYVKNIFALPFDTTLWLTEISILFVCVVLLYVIVRWEWKGINEKRGTPEYDMIPNSFSDAILFVIGAVCNQGYATEPKGSPGKIIMLTVFITIIFLFTAYTACTVVLFQSTADNIKTLEDLYKSKITMATDDTFYARARFPTYTEKWRQKIYQDRLAPNGNQTNYFPLRTGLQRVRNEYFAFHIDGAAGFNAISDMYYEHEKCGLQIIKYMTETDAYTVAPIGTPFLKQFKIAYMRVRETGLHKAESLRRMTSKPKCVTQGNNYRSAGLLDLYSVYMLLIIGLVLSLCILLLEILFHKLISPMLF